VLDDALLGSLEYATSHLGTPLVVILGHSRCGAMGAALAGGELPGRLPAIVDVLRPSVEAARRLPGDPLAHAARAHARAMAERVRRAEPVLAGRVAAGATRVIAAYYDIETGAVEVLE
jgi:carbonic anhydrase